MSQHARWLIIRSVAGLAMGSVLMALVGCGGRQGAGQEDGVGYGAAEVEVALEVRESGPESLSARIAERQAELSAGLSEEMVTTFAEGLEAVRASGVVERAVQVGQQAPGFELAGPTGETVTLAELLAEGPVVLLWYRGGWCPYCSLTLHAYQESLDEIHAAGGRLVALTPELPDRSLSTAEKNELDFSVLSDIGNEVARQYGVVFTLTPEVREIYEAAFELSAYNGDDSGELPLAATYVIDQGGVVRWAFLDHDYTKRAEPADVVAALQGLAG